MDWFTLFIIFTLIAFPVGTLCFAWVMMKTISD